jgi:hypothetical protein
MERGNSARHESQMFQAKTGKADFGNNMRENLDDLGDQIA